MLSPHDAYRDALNNGHSKYLEDCVMESPKWAYFFAEYIHGANIERLHDAVLTDPKYSYYFAYNFPHLNMSKLQEAVLSDAFYSYMFALKIHGADLELLSKHMGKHLDHYHNEIIQDIIE